MTAQTHTATAQNAGSRVHTTVLLHESIQGLALKRDSIYLDGTLGAAGHMKLATETVPSLTVIGLDRDESALAHARDLFKEKVAAGSAHFVSSNYRDLDRALDGLGIGKVDAIMLDLGLSSDQFETSGRGFTFRKDEPLLITFAAEPMSETNPGGYTLTAKEILNTWSEEEIANVIFDYGEEGFSRKIARAVIEAREMKPIETTADLVAIVEKATPAWYHHRRIHPATKTFQALRIAVNDELGSLKDGIARGFERLASGGRMAIISFHSLEDRIVKHTFREYADRDRIGGPIAELVTKRAIIPTDAEIEANPRARSAKLRIIKKI